MPGEPRGGRHEGLRPGLMRPEASKEADPLGPVKAQGPIICRQPARDSPVPHTFEATQQPQRHHITRPHGGLGTFRDAVHVIIHLAA